MIVQTKGWGCLALSALVACSNEPQQVVTPSLPVAPRYAQIGSGHGGPVTIASVTVDVPGGFLGVCVSPSSPAGNYSFTINDYFVPGGIGSLLSLIPSNNVVTPGDCIGLGYRVAPEDHGNPPADPATSITYSYASNDVVGGADFASVTCHDDPGNPVTSQCPLGGTAATVVGGFNYVFGTFAVFSFEQTPTQMIAALRVTLDDLDLRKGTDHKLDDMLEKIQKDIDKEHTSHACKELDHFIKEVSGHEWKKVGSADGAILVAKANAIKVALGC